MNPTTMGGEPRVPLIPPGQHRAYAGHHWVEERDFDGRSRGLEVYQWQPGVKKWCRPNEFASGRDLDLVAYRWVGPCPTPVLKPEYDEFKLIMEKVSQGETPTAEELVVMRRIIYEQVFPRL